MGPTRQPDWCEGSRVQKPQLMQPSLQFRAAHLRLSVTSKYRHGHRRIRTYKETAVPHMLHYSTHVRARLKFPHLSLSKGGWS